MLSIVACGDNGPAAHCDHSLPERGIWKTPIYPGAQQINNDDSMGERITFVTDDTSGEVYTYYDALLKKSGWKPDQLTGHVYGVANCCYYGRLTINSEFESDGQTKVTIESGWAMGCG